MDQVTVTEGRGLRYLVEVNIHPLQLEIRSAIVAKPQFVSPLKLPACLCCVEARVDRMELTPQIHRGRARQRWFA